ncbi:MAG: ferrous iron transporter B [Kiritimatiellae bacterium]|nr:ferrous iron transporter B [Kiritimatiellia bacterium]
MSIKIALAGNPNSGKTTLFNELTGSNQYVGNWPGVTVEKKDGRLKSNKDVVIQDLPGIYSLSPYSLEEKVSRKFLVEENPDAILNIVDGTNIERNLYLSTQLAELGLPMVIAVNMMDVVKRNGDKIDFEKIARSLNCQVVGISALKKNGCLEAAQKALELARSAADRKRPEVPHVFTGSVEHAIAHIEETIQGKVPAKSIRWFAIKIFERDREIIKDLGIGVGEMKHLEEHIRDCEKELDDDAESIITNQRYEFIKSLTDKALSRSEARRNKATLSDKIDKIVTNRILALPIFLVSLCAMWWLAAAGDGPGTVMTDWANDQFLGEDGWFLPFTEKTHAKDSSPYSGMSYEEAGDAYAPHEKNIEAWESAYVEQWNEANKDKEGFEPLESFDEEKVDEAFAKTVIAEEVQLDDDEETGEPVLGKTDRAEGNLIELSPCECCPGECALAREKDPSHVCDDCVNDDGEPKEVCEDCLKKAKWEAAYIEAYDKKNGEGSYAAKLEEFNRDAEKAWREASAKARAEAHAQNKTYIPGALFEESGFEIFDVDGNGISPIAAALALDREFGERPGDCDCCDHKMVWSCDWEMYKASKEFPEVNPSDYGVFIPGLTTLVESGLDAIGVNDTVKALVKDGAWAGVATVLGFVPVIAIVFLFLAFLEDCGYMARVAFIMDRLFRRFGLSGKSFIPMIVGKGCGVPAVMAARTIENERDRRMTIILSTFVPCGAKTAIIVMFSVLFFRDMWYVAALMDVIGIAIIVLGGIALKKTRAFAGEAAPFVMELPAYHMPTLKGIVIHTWERVKAYMLKAGLIIFPACVFLWFIMSFDFKFNLVGDAVSESMLATMGNWIAWMLAPLGFGTWQGAAASVSAEIAKEQATATLALVSSEMTAASTGAQIQMLFSSMSDFPKLAAMSFMLFNLFIPPCMVAIAVTFREMGSKAWGWLAIAFQLVVGYLLSLWVYQIGMLVAGGVFGVWTAVALVLLVAALWFIFRPAPKLEEVAK